MSSLFQHPGLSGHELLDSGNGEKLERFGDVALRRPDPQAIWRPSLGQREWEGADFAFRRESDRGGSWANSAGAGPPREWEMPVAVPGLPPAVALIRPTPFKHVGLFPEQAANWLWLEERRKALVASSSEPPRLLNLFAYTGMATVLASLSGWKVTHVDASRASLDWAAANASRNGLPEDAVRWIVDDAAKFSARELRRDRRYDAILLDPPAYGRGPNGEKWLFDREIAELLETCRALLDPEQPACLAMSAYAVGFSPLAFSNLLADWGGSAEAGELAIPESGSDRLLPCGYCVRWQRDS